MAKKELQKQSVLGDMPPAKSIVKLAIPATLALLAKAVYNLVDTAYIGMLNSDIALTAVGVTVPLLLIMVSIENIFAAGAAVLAGRQLGAKENESASRTVTTIIGISVIIGVILCVGGIVFMEPLMRAFGASDASLPQAEDYAFWMFIAALANLPAQSMNCAARAESSVKISSIAVITGALLNVLLDPVFMFDWGLNMGVEGASFATTVSQFVTFFILIWFYASGRSIIKIKAKAFKPGWKLIKTVAVIVNYGKWLLISQVALYPAFGLCYMMTITYQTIGSSRYGLFLSMIRQGLFYVSFILILPKLFGVTGIYFSQPAADILTILVCLCSVKSMKATASRNMGAEQG